MARPARLIAASLFGLVLLAHLAAVEGLLRQRAARPPSLQPMKSVLWTRLVRPEAPVVPAAERPATVASAGAVPTAVAAVPPLHRHPREGGHPGLPAAPAIVPAEPVAPEEPVATLPDEAPSAPIDEPPSPDPWPPDTRLTYRLEGQYRSGPIYGEARVYWQREGERYQARLELDVRFFGSIVMTSQGEATPQGLVPRAFEEVRAGQRRVARLRGRPPGVQDAVSQFVELGHRFATGRDVLAVGHSVRFPMVRPEGMDHWTYDVVASEPVDTPELGRIEAFHLQPRPLAKPRGDITAQMWFAPTLQYLPVRIQVRMGDGVMIDLVVKTIEQ